MSETSRIYLFEDTRSKTNRNIVANVQVNRLKSYHLHVNQELVSKATGKGYDKESTVFADWINKHYRDRLQRLVAPLTKEEKKDGLYGLIHLSQVDSQRTRNVKRVPKSKRDSDKYCTYIRENVGMDSIMKILKAIGINWIHLKNDKDPRKERNESN